MFTKAIVILAPLLATLADPAHADICADYTAVASASQPCLESIDFQAATAALSLPNATKVLDAMVSNIIACICSNPAPLAKLAPEVGTNVAAITTCNLTGPPLTTVNVPAAVTACAAHNWPGAAAALGGFYLSIPSTDGAHYYAYWALQGNPVMGPFVLGSKPPANPASTAATTAATPATTAATATTPAAKSGNAKVAFVTVLTAVVGIAVSSLLLRQRKEQTKEQRGRLGHASGGNEDSLLPHQPLSFAIHAKDWHAEGGEEVFADVEGQNHAGTGAKRRMSMRMETRARGKEKNKAFIANLLPLLTATARNSYLTPAPKQCPPMTASSSTAPGCSNQHSSWGPIWLSGPTVARLLAHLQLPAPQPPPL
ncbi:hypothetical protein BDK51DRAFT_46497 [Blyttiomyces helicus]|uniref:Uncharacterized protein n=1 Tax=Blyttiomyces helicus TaxID=388810 RepID=A0A4P9WI99_9FUNG|nr:hypothetical protein BDK51DRAFT_46497 [Blyttiomyces helicus]|eukprot:RKO92494.1 hypothetical protein BDK51DRAFT_46497 [Blyttiomyces helicus]